MSSEEKKIVDFVLHLPPHINPYGAVSQHMKQVLTPPRMATWATVAQRCAALLLVLMFLQAAHLIYARVRVGAFKLWSFTRLGLYHVDIASTAGLTYILYCILAIVDLVILDFSNAGKRDLSGELVLFGCKYVMIVGNAWFFLWVCACQCATLICESGLGETPGTGRRLHPVIRVSMNASLFTVLFVPIPLVVYRYTKVNTEYGMAKSILYDVLQALDTKAATVTPHNYSRMELLAMLTPARGIQPHARQMARSTRMGIIVYLAELIVLSVLYVPLLSLSLSRLYARSVSQKQLCKAASGGEASEKFSSMGRKIREQRTRLVTHAIMSYMITALHVPIIIAQLSYKGDGFLLDKTWLTITRVGLSLPFSIGGNVIAFILNLHARNQLIDAQDQNPASSTMNPSFSGSKNKEPSLPRYNQILNGQENVSLSVLPTHINQSSESTLKSIRQNSSVHFKEKFNNRLNDQKSEIGSEESISKN